jgi:peroxiredoxin Q/BCP
VDPGERLAQFAAKFRLPFVLLSDRGGAVAARYGSLINLGWWKLARRNSFLIDPQGRVAKVYLSANPSDNAQQVIDDLQRLKKGVNGE